MSKETLEKRQAEAARRRRWDREEEAAREADAEFERQLGAEEYHRTTRARDFGMPTRATPVVKKDGGK